MAGEVDDSLQTIDVRLRAVVTTDLRLNEPRYVSLPDFMKAKKKLLDEKTPVDFGARARCAQDRGASRRKAGIKFKTVAQE